MQGRMSHLSKVMHENIPPDYVEIELLEVLSMGRGDLSLQFHYEDLQNRPDQVWPS